MPSTAMDQTQIKRYIKKVKTSKQVFKNSSHIKLLCRVCLNEGDILIYGDEGVGDISESLKMYCGIEIQEDDEFPSHLCHACHEQLQSAIKLTQTAQETEQYLKNSLLSNDDDFMLQMEEKYEQNNVQKLFMETLADINTIYHCRSCKLDFASLTEYSHHMFSADHSNLKDRCPFCCRECSSIQKHLALHVHSKTVKCNVCGEKFLRPNFLRHRESHCEMLLFKCSKCPYRGRRAADLKIHIRRHTGERPYECIYCSAGFISKSNLNRHLLTHKSDCTFQCDECPRGFYNQHDLDLHIKVNHFGVKEHLCNICGKAFGYRKALMKHLLQVHKREKLRGGKMPVYMRKQIENDILTNPNYIKTEIVVHDESY